MIRIPLPITVLTAVVLAGSATASFAQVDNEPRYGWSVAGPVFDLARVDNTIYAVGGAGLGVAPSTNQLGKFAVVSATHGLIAQLTESVNAGSVAAVVGDGAGGFYIGGPFQNVAGEIRNGLAHLRPDGELDPVFNPNVNGGVLALSRQGTTLYAVGNFTAVGGQGRGGGAAFDLAAGGALLPWNPQLDAVVGSRGGNALAINGAVAYVGGTFTTASATARVGFAAVDATSGALLPTPVADLNPGGIVNALLVSGTTIYLGGNFGTVSGASRNNLAAVDTTVGAALPFTAGTNNTVRSLLLDGADLYVGGGFTLVAGQPRLGIARVDATTGGVSTWRADTNGAVIALLKAGATLYMGGGFTSVAGQLRSGAAALTPATGAVLPWNPGFGGGAVMGMVLTPAGDVAVAGAYTHFGVASRSGLAAIDLVRNELLPLNVTVNNQVLGVTVSGDTLYLAGAFTTVNGVARNYFAAVNRRSGELLPWNPNATGSIGIFNGGRDIAVLGTTALIGGYFTSVGGQARNGLAEVDATSGALTASTLEAAGGGVNTFVRSGSTLYVTGNYTAIAGQPRTALAAFDVSGAAPALTPFAPAITGLAVYSARVVGTTLYMGGAFSAINGQARNNSGAVTLPAGTVTAFAPGVNPGGPVNDIDVYGDTAYLAGGFTTVNGQTRRSFAAVDAATGQTTRALDMQLFGGDGRAVMASSEGLLAAGSGLDDGENVRFLPRSGMSGLPGRPAPPSTFTIGNLLAILWGPPAVGGAPIDWIVEVGTGPGLTNIAAIHTNDDDPEFEYMNAPAGLYYVRVRAVSAAGVGPASEEVAFVPGTAACGGGPRPVTPAASVSGSNVLITWSDALLANGGLSYTLSASTVPGIVDIGSFAVGSAMQFAAVAPPGAYYVRVGASGPCGVSAPSSELLVSVGGVVPTAAPVATSSVAGGVVSIAWTAVAGATSYRLDAGTGPLLSNIAQLPLGATSFSTPAPAGTYYVRIHAIGPAGVSLGSNEQVIVVP